MTKRPAPNLNTRLKRRRRAQPPMTAYDRLPPELRAWLSEAALPWSPQSALKLWKRYMSESQGCAEAALERLQLAERHSLRRDAPKVWGAEYPGP